MTNANRAVAVMIEVTGMEVEHGHRIVEVGAIEIVNRELTLNRFHTYVNAGTESDAESLALHGLTGEFLADKPRFNEVATGLADFLRGATLIAYPCDWTVRFLDSEFINVGAQSIAMICAGVVDIKPLAEKRAPGQRINLNALCERYRMTIPKSLLGTVLDAWMLAKAYLDLTRDQAASKAMW